MDNKEVGKLILGVLRNRRYIGKKWSWEFMLILVRLEEKYV